MDRQNNNNNNNNAADALAVADSIERMLASAESNPFQQEDPQQRARNDAPELIMARQMMDAFMAGRREGGSQK